jgi:hypothetical protein
MVYYVSFLAVVFASSRPDGQEDCRSSIDRLRNSMRNREASLYAKSMTPRNGFIRRKEPHASADANPDDTTR